MSIDWKAEAERLDRLVDEWMVKSVEEASKVVRMRKALQHILAWADLQPSGWVDFIRNECHQNLDPEPMSPITASHEDAK